jgi:hypothetical protein
MRELVGKVNFKAVALNGNLCLCAVFISISNRNETIADDVIALVVGVVDLPHMQ